MAPFGLFNVLMYISLDFLECAIIDGFFWTFLVVVIDISLDF